MVLTPPAWQRLTASAVLTVALSGCGNTLQRLSEMNSEPQLTPISNPQAVPGYRPVTLPMPAPQIPDSNPNSLWRAGAKSFFKDIRAKDVGDTLTVRLKLNDSAKLDNSTERGRDLKETAGVDAAFGYEKKITKWLPKNDDDAAAAAALRSKTKTSGDGGISRKEKIELVLAAVVTQVLPNGSLVIEGRQEIRVNYELRQLHITGVIRPPDIDPDNSIPYEKIAEMRVAYGGRGTLSELQQPRWGAQIWDILFPF
jgi:flagellar L-ring protein precursor FlgH